MTLTDDQVKAAIIKFPVMKGRWGAHHFPIDTLVNWMGRKIERNGRTAREPEDPSLSSQADPLSL